MIQLVQKESIVNFNLLTDEDMIKEFGKRYEIIRLQKRLSDNDVAKKGGISKDAIHRLKNGSNINLSNFIKILRGLDELDSLEKLIIPKKEPISIRDLNPKKTPKRIFKSKKSSTNIDFKWGDDK